ncbi:MAG: hypothetical protein KH135_02500 [Firmicutes bacterium]|nr:hypothetical protein [Bacillota bacterium]
MDIHDIKFYKRMGTDALQRDKGLALITSASYFGCSLLYAYCFMNVDAGKDILAFTMPLIFTSGMLEARKYKKYKAILEEINSYEEKEEHTKSR